MDRAVDAAERPQSVPEEGTRAVPVPRYLSRHYWWAYIHPWAVKFWDHLWIVNLILLTNYRRLRDAALQEIESGGRVLQLACVYGDLTPKIAACVAAKGGALDVVDVLPIQLRNTRRKLADARGVRFLNMDSSRLDLPSRHYDQVLLFFLLHEQPKEVRDRTLAEAFRVVKPGGRVLIVDFAKPYWWSPFRYLWLVFLAVFEPFALGLWWHDLAELLPAHCRAFPMTRERFFAGLFQKVMVSCRTGPPAGS
jgi:ubiquinone/menaquinone biosynthesis C-methylase UbiE